MVVGVDEVGRGSWAGPLLVVAASAVALLPGGLKDSKLLSKKQRTDLFERIKLTCRLGEGWVEPAEIDKYGLAQAMRLGISRALSMLGAHLDDTIIMDGKVNYCPTDFSQVQCVVNADALHPIVSAASIYAKVLRDSHMIRLAKCYPNYGFEQHVGYGTKLHSLQLKQYGPCPIHRKSYKPVQALVSALPAI